MNDVVFHRNPFRTWALAFGGVIAGVFATAFLLIDPMDLHSLDEHLRGGAMEHESASHDGMVHDAAAHDHGQHAGGELWTCGMHPQVIEEEPGQCPICHMDLVPLEVEEEVAEEDSGPGVASDTIRIDPVVVQNMNVRTAATERRDMHHPFRTVGYLDYDQERMVTVTTKYQGFIEKVNVNYVGEEVRKGQPLFEIYSPELVQTQHELLSAVDFARRLEGAPDDSRARALALVDAARTRLGYWDVTGEQIARLEKTREVFRTIDVGAPTSGVVMKRIPSLEGMAVSPGMELFHIANLETLWLSVEIFEDQIAWVRVGTPAEVSFSYLPGETFRGTVRIIEPELTEQTRTLKVRITVPNPGRRLRAGMFATVVFRPRSASEVLAVPSQAVLRTGTRNVVIVALGEGRFAPREVVLGHEGEGWVEVRSGLDDGARVVTSAQFLLDSEASVRAAIQRMLAERSSPSEPAGGSVHVH